MFVDSLEEYNSIINNFATNVAEYTLATSTECICVRLFEMALINIKSVQLLFSNIRKTLSYTLQ